MTKEQWPLNAKHNTLPVMIYIILRLLQTTDTSATPYVTETVACVLNERVSTPSPEIPF